MWELALTTIMVVGALLLVIGAIIRSWCFVKVTSGLVAGCSCKQCKCGKVSCISKTKEAARTESTMSVITRGIAVERSSLKELGNE